MRTFLAKLIVAVFLFVLAYNLPIYPYLYEFREYSQEQESLYQAWGNISLPDYYHNAVFARTAGIESTSLVYNVLAVAYPLLLVTFCWVIAGGVIRRK